MSDLAQDNVVAGKDFMYKTVAKWTRGYEKRFVECKARLELRDGRPYEVAEVFVELMSNFLDGFNKDLTT